MTHYTRPLLTAAVMMMLSATAAHAVDPAPPSNPNDSLSADTNMPYVPDPQQAVEEGMRPAGDVYDNYSDEDLRIEQDRDIVGMPLDDPAVGDRDTIGNNHIVEMSDEPDLFEADDTPSYDTNYEDGTAEIIDGY